MKYLDKPRGVYYYDNRADKTKTVISENKEKLISKIAELDNIIENDNISNEKAITLLEEQIKMCSLLDTLNKCENEINIYSTTPKKETPSIKNLEIDGDTIKKGVIIGFAAAGGLLACFDKTQTIGLSLIAGESIILGATELVKRLNY